ncbi:MAG TPA: thioredoxin domain-containing protein [Candidatus Paceibacterota bacterium]|nr:thioredoxin domain-containing protein [Candidatus Paceibacterota bacterium]
MKGKSVRQKGNKTVLIVVVIIVAAVALIAAAVVLNPSGPSPAAPAFVATTAPAITTSDWTQGNASAKATLIEYGDFQCPACGAWYPIVKQLFASESSSILFVFRNYPLYQIHPDAGIAAQAAEAAGLQGKYWGMFDMLYENQNTWSTVDPAAVVAQYFNGYASSLGLDVSKFDSDINSDGVKNKIKNDVDGGNSAQIDHTPTFFVNLKQINPQNPGDLQNDITQALQASQ